MDLKHVIAHDKLRSKLWEVAPASLAGSFNGQGEVLGLLRSNMATAIVLPSDWCNEWAVESLCREIRSRAPTLLIIAVVLAPTDEATSAPEVERLTCVFLQDPGWLAQIRELLGASSVSAREQRAAASVASGLPQDSADLVRRAVLEARDRRPIAQWLDGAPVSRRQIERRCQGEVRMSPDELRMWGRLLVGIISLECTFASVDEIAIALGYEGRASFTHLCRKLMGLPPRRLARRSGSKRVIDVWRERMGPGGGGLAVAMRLSYCSTACRDTALGVALSNSVSRWMLSRLG